MIVFFIDNSHAVIRIRMVERSEANIILFIQSLQPTSMTTSQNSPQLPAFFRSAQPGMTLFFFWGDNL